MCKKSLWSTLSSWFNPTLDAHYPESRATYEQWQEQRMHVELIANEVSVALQNTLVNMDEEQADILNDLSRTVRERHNLATELGEMYWKNGFTDERVDTITLQRYFTKTDMQTLVWEYTIRATADQLYKIILNRLLLHEDFANERIAQKKKVGDARKAQLASIEAGVPQMWDLGGDPDGATPPLLIEPQYPPSPRVRTAASRRSPRRVILIDTDDV